MGLLAQHGRPVLILRLINAAEMTQAINTLPNVYTRLGQMGLFR